MDTNRVKVKKVFASEFKDDTPDTDKEAKAMLEALMMSLKVGQTRALLVAALRELEKTDEYTDVLDRMVAFAEQHARHFSDDVVNYLKHPELPDAEQVEIFDNMVKEATALTILTAIEVSNRI